MIDMPPLFQIIGRWFWLIAIIFSVIQKGRWQRRNFDLLLEHPELAGDFKRLVKRWLIWSDLPWLVVGLGCVFGGLTAWDYLPPREANPFVIAFYVTVFLLWLVSLWWLFFRGGADELARFPGIINLFGVFPTDPKTIKGFFAFGTVAAIVGIFFMVTMESPLPYWKSEGPEYTTVFVIYDGYWRALLWGLLWLAIGVGIMTVAIIWIRRLNLPKWWNRKEALRPGFLLFLSVLWVLGTGVGFGSDIWHQTKLVNIFRNGQAQVVEGQVHILHEQPASGHAKGDVVEVGGQQFTLNYFVITAAYNRTIAYGGELREGRNVRIWYHDEDILALAVRP